MFAGNKNSAARLILLFTKKKKCYKRNLQNVPTNVCKLLN